MVLEVSEAWQWKVETRRDYSLKRATVVTPEKTCRIGDVIEVESWWRRVELRTSRLASCLLQLCRQEWYTFGQLGDDNMLLIIRGLLFH